MLQQNLLLLKRGYQLTQAELYNDLYNDLTRSLVTVVFIGPYR